MKSKVKKAIKKDKPIFWRNLMYQTIYFLSDSPAPEIVFMSSLILSRWWLNSDFSYPVELIIPVVMFGLLSSGIYYMYRAIFGKGSAAHLAAILLSYSFYGYEFIHNTSIVSTYLKIIPNGFRTDFSQSILFAVTAAFVCGTLAWVIRWLIQRFSGLQKIEPYKVLLFAVVFIFSIQGFRFVQRYFQIKDELSYKPQAVNIAKPAATSDRTKPDIYYILFDRYTNADALQKNFNYDNSDLIKFLGDEGFVTRNGAYSNYPFTTPSVSSTMSMKYLNEFKSFNGDSNWESLFPYRTILNDPPIAQILKQNGYTYNQVSSWWDFTRLRVKADNNYAKSFRLNVLSAHFYLSDLQRDILHKSILSPWLKKGVGRNILKYDLDRNPRENFDAQVSSLKSIASRADKSQPNFTFAHILAPHPPYVFNRDGSSPSYDNEANDNGVPEKTKYTNELTYVNKRMKDLITHIRSSSPNAVVFVQADEGPYPAQFRGKMTPAHYYDPADLSLDDMRQKFGILASYYMPDASQEDINEINASVNVFPFILNRYLGYDLPLLPDCQFSMGNKYNVYSYSLVTDKLTGKPADPNCKQYE